MKAFDFLQMVMYFGSLALLTPLLGKYLIKVYMGGRHFLSGMLGPLERVIYRWSGIRPEQEMPWTAYLAALLWLHGLGFALLVAILRMQSWLPLNPQRFEAVPWALALNIGVSFVTNTDWQAYAGEIQLSYLSQMLGLTVQFFLSAAAGMAVLVALGRGLARWNATTVGNFWVDLTRTVIYILLPAAVVLCAILAAQGTVQTLRPYVAAETLEGGRQVIPLGPVASQTAIKVLGTNGGGFFNANSSHPFENPTPLTNFMQILAMMILPAACTSLFGRMIGSRRHGWILFWVMSVFFLASVMLAWWGQSMKNPVTGTAIWLEGKEWRFGVFGSIYYAMATTAAACGAVNALHDSLSPLAGMAGMINMLQGEVVFGGAGTGMYTMVLYAIMTVFLAGLMVGRTPEYIGKKIEGPEVVWALVGIFSTSMTSMVGAAVACITPAALAGLGSAGPHGLSELLYAYASCSGNNGSAFAGLDSSRPFYLGTLAAAMLVGRFGVIVPVLAVAGSLVRKRTMPPNPGVLPADTLTFGMVLAGVILIVGLLNFFPMLAMGPLAEHLLMLRGRTF